MEWMVRMDPFPTGAPEAHRITAWTGGHAHAWSPPGRITYRFFFLWRFFRRRFLRLWVAILWRFRFLPQGMGQ